MEDTLAARERVLEAVLDDPMTKPELVENLSASRSTIDRAIAALLEKGCVRNVDSAFVATEKGRLAFQARLEYLEDLESVREAEPVLRALPSGSVGLELVRGATVDVPDPRTPWKAFEESARIAHEAHSLTGTGPVVFQQFFGELSRSVENGGLRCELVVDADLLDSLDDTQWAQLRTIIESDGGSLHRADLTDPFAIWIAELEDREHAGITVYGEGGVAGVIRSSEPAAVAWARAEYEARKADAEVVWDFERESADERQR